MTQDNILDHYNRVGKAYDHLLKAKHQARFVADLYKYLDFQSPGTRVVDIGAGTCFAAIDLATLVGLKTPVVCVEPSQQMLDSAKGHPLITPLCMGAVEFSRLEEQSYDRAFCREMIHHISDDNLPEMLTNISRQLTSKGVLVIERIHRPDNFPWFRKFMDAFWQQDIEFLLANLRRDENLFDDVVRHVEYVPVTWDKRHYYKMLRERYISTLHTFTDEDIEEGIQELELKYGEMDEIDFTYEREYIVAKKTN